MVSTGQASCTWSNKRVCSVFDLLTVAYLRFHFGGGGGGVKLILGQWRFLHGESMRLLGWLGGMLHSRIVFKNGAIIRLTQVGAFWSIFCYNFVKKM